MIATPKKLSEERLRTIGMQHGYSGEYIYLRHKTVANFADKWIKKIGIKNALNIGCGLGIMEHFMDEVIPIKGIDIVDDEIKVAKKLATETNRPYSYIKFDVKNLKCGSYDLVILSEVIEHVENDHQILDIARKNLSNNGVLLVTVPNRMQLRNRFRKIFGKKLVLMDQTHIREYTSSEIEVLFHDSGFSVLDKDVSILYFPFEKFFLKIIPTEHFIREYIIKVLPKIASHLIYILKYKNL